jgi:hypothetical protein
VQLLRLAFLKISKFDCSLEFLGCGIVGMFAIALLFIDIDQ